MSKTADAIIIGAGVIGAAIAFELAKKGWKTLSVDRNREAGHGSTSGNRYKNAPLAFTLPSIGRSIGLGFFSRKRPIDEEGRFPVPG